MPFWISLCRGIRICNRLRIYFAQQLLHQMPCLLHLCVLGNSIAAEQIPISPSQHAVPAPLICPLIALFNRLFVLLGADLGIEAQMRAFADDDGLGGVQSELRRPCDKGRAEPFSLPIVIVGRPEVQISAIAGEAV